MGTRVTLVDDLDGADADETINFSVNGKYYEIDLSVKNAKKFYEFMQTYTVHGRRVTAARPGRRTNAPTAPAPTSAATPAARPTTYARTSKDQNKAIREWAKKNGHEIPARGRIPNHIQEAFEAAHTK